MRMENGYCLNKISVFLWPKGGIRMFFASDQAPFNGEALKCEADHGWQSHGE